MPSPALARSNGRAATDLRPIRMQPDAIKWAEGSVLIEVGDTRVLCAASVERRVPPFLVGSDKGWITAEYAMLPRATHTRSKREVTQGRPSGRTAEIQRLIGRSLRAAVDLRLLGERTLTLDCDVLQADGGTRTASITGAYVATALALGKLMLAGDLKVWPLVAQVAAVSVGIVEGVAVLDLDYPEDGRAEVDMNVVGTVAGELVEVQGTAEGSRFGRAQLDSMIDLAMAGIVELGRQQDRLLAGVLAEVAALEGKSRRPAAPRDERTLWGPLG